MKSNTKRLILKIFIVLYSFAIIVWCDDSVPFTEKAIYTSIVIAMTALVIFES